MAFINKNNKFNDSESLEVDNKVVLKLSIKHMQY